MYNSYSSLQHKHRLLQGAFLDFPLAWVRVLSRPHSANNHDMTLRVVSTLGCELSAGWFVVFVSVSSRPGRTQEAGYASEVTCSVTRTQKKCQRKVGNEEERWG